MQVGDIVIVKDENLSRNQWRLGQISAASPGDDGLVRKVSLSVVLKSVDNKGKVVCSITKLERLIHKFVPLKETGE